MLSALVGVLLAAPPAPSHPEASLGEDWKLVVDGQVRPRLYFDTGRDFVDGDRHEYVTQRSRLGVTLTDDEDLAIVVRLQDVRAWGEEENTTDFEAEGLDLHEAYGQLKAGGLMLRAGRQEVVLDNERLVGNLNWRQSARAFDGLRLRFEGTGWDADVFGTVIAESDADDPDANVPTDRSGNVLFGGARGHKKLGESLDASLAYYVRSGKPADELRHTAGGYLHGGVGGLKYTVDGYYQFGSLGDESINAYMAGLRAGYEAGALGFWAIADYLSGDGTPEGVFDTLYATNHAFYGEMDFFLDIPRNTAGLGLIDLGGRVVAKASDTVTASVTYHYFRAAEDSPQGNADFGSEIDTRLDWKATPHLGIYLLYGIFLPGDAIADVRGIPGDPEMEQQLYVTTDLSF
jgi:hypothetical protein